MKNVLIIGSVWPEPKSSAAGSHMMQLISAFQSKKYEITFSSACTKTANAVDLKDFGIIQIEIQLNHSSFDNFIKELDPEIVVFDRFMTEEQFGWRVSEVCPNALKILNTEDLHCLRKGRHKALKENKIFDKRYLFNDIAKRELASIYRCDLSLIISEAELEILDKDFEVNASLLHYFPFLLESISEDKINKLARFEDRQHYVSIGNFFACPKLRCSYLFEECYMAFNPATNAKFRNAYLWRISTAKATAIGG